MVYNLFMDPQIEKKTSIPVDEPTPTPPPDPVKIGAKSVPKMPMVGLLAVLLVLALGAVGFLVYQNMQLSKKLAEVQSVTSLPIVSPSPYTVPSPIVDGTASWKTYTSIKFGFSFRYPQNSTVKSDTLDVDGSLEFDNFILFVEKTDDILANYVSKLKDTNGIAPVTKSIGDKSAIEWIGSFRNTPTHYLSFEDRGYVYSFGVTPVEDMTKFSSNDTNFLGQILSTFKFTN